MFRRDYDQVVGEWIEAPPRASFTLRQSGWESVEIMSSSWDDESSWGKAWYDLWFMVPKPWEEDYQQIKKNSPELREQAAQYIRITYNGQPVTGNVATSRGNGHTDLYFSFDQPIAFAQGDEIRVWVGLPEEN